MSDCEKCKVFLILKKVPHIADAPCDREIGARWALAGAAHRDWQGAGGRGGGGRIRRRLGRGHACSKFHIYSSSILQSTVERAARAAHGGTLSVRHAGPCHRVLLGESVDLDGRVDLADEDEARDEAEGARDEEEGDRHHRHVAHVDEKRHCARHLQRPVSVGSLSGDVGLFWGGMGNALSM